MHRPARIFHREILFDNKGVVYGRTVVHAEPVANARGADDMIVSGATSAQMK